MHEMHMHHFEVLPNGGYNTVFKLTDTADGSTHIAKILKYARDYTDRNLDRVRRDSLIMERATASDHVLNTFSYCGFSQIIEYGNGGDLNQLLSTAYYESLSQTQKLLIAIQVSQALADIHNLEGNNISSVTHGDLAAKQYIISVNGRFKLSDFNRGRFLQWNAKTLEPCPYSIGSNDGNFRSPEEYKYIPQTSAIDVWALGGILVKLVTGEEVWSGYDDWDAQQAIIGGKLPPFREKIKNRSDPINELLEKAVQMCYVYDPKDRPKALAVLEYLEKESKRLGVEVILSGHGEGMLNHQGLTYELSIPYMPITY